MAIQQGFGVADLFPEVTVFVVVSQMLLQIEVLWFDLVLGHFQGICPKI